MSKGTANINTFLPLSEEIRKINQVDLTRFEDANINNLFNGSVQPETLEYDKSAKKWYFKGFLMNNKINRRKFGVLDPEVIDRDIDTFIGLPLTEVTEGIRKGDHAMPEDAGIIESREPSKYDFVSKAIKYYRDFGKANIINIFKPDRNLFNASKNDPSKELTWYAQYETTDEELANRIEAANKDPENNPTPKVSPSIYGVRWHYNSNKEIVVDQFVGTHVGIVNKGAYGEVAYIKPEVCNIDGKTCYYKLLNASDLENLNNDVPKTKDIMNTANIFNDKLPRNLTEYINSGYSFEVTDVSKVDLSKVSNDPNSEFVLVKKIKPQDNNTNTNNQNNNNNQSTQPQNDNNNNTNNQTNQNNTNTNTNQNNVNTNQYVHINDVRAMINEEINKVKQEFAEQQAREKQQSVKAAIYAKYFDSLENIKQLNGKIDIDKINKQKEFYDKLNLEPEVLETVLANSIFNTQNTTPEYLISKFALPNNNNNSDNKNNNQSNQPEPVKPQNDNNTNNQNQSNPSKVIITDSITSIPPKTNNDLVMGNFLNPNNDNNNQNQSAPAPVNNNGFSASDFKSSENHNAAGYNDNYNNGNGNSNFNASDNKKGIRTTTGSGIPKKFRNIMQNGIS